MRKIFNIFIAFIFLTSFVGIQINTHYSKGELYSVTVYQEAKSCCNEMHATELAEEMPASCEHDTKEDCSCKNITELIKISDVFYGTKYTAPGVITIDLVSVPFMENVKAVINVSLQNNILYYMGLPSLTLDFQTVFSIFLC